MKTQRKPRLALLAALLCAAVTLSACSSAEPTEAEQSAPEGTTSIESTVSEESTEAPSSKEESSAPAEESSEASSSEAGSSEEAASSRPEPVEDDGSQHQRSFTAMDTAVSFTTFGGGEISLDEAEAELSRLEAMFSVTNKDGDVGRLNAADGKSTGTRQIWLPNVCSQEHDANKTKIWDLKDMDADHVQAWKNSFDLVHCYKKVGHSRN